MIQVSENDFVSKAPGVIETIRYVGDVWVIGTRDDEKIEIGDEYVDSFFMWMVGEL